MTIEIRSYELDIAEIVIIMKCVNDNPKLDYMEIGKLLGISKTSLYRKLSNKNLDSLRGRLIELGYTLSELRSITIKNIQ